MSGAAVTLLAKEETEALRQTSFGAASNAKTACFNPLPKFARLFGIPSLSESSSASGDSVAWLDLAPGE